MLIFQFYQCNLKLYKLTHPYAKFCNQSSKRNNPKLSWSFCSKFFGAKYGFFLDKQIFPHVNLYECLIYYSLSFQIMVFKHNSSFKGCRIKLLSEKKDILGVRYQGTQVVSWSYIKLKVLYMLNSRPVSMERSSTHSPGDSHKVFLTQFFFTQLSACLRKSYEGIEKWCEKRLNPCFRDIKPVNEWCYKPEYSPKDTRVENKVPLVSDVDCYDCIFSVLFMFTVVK